MYLKVLKRELEGVAINGFGFHSGPLNIEFKFCLYLDVPSKKKINLIFLSFEVGLQNAIRGYKPLHGH